MKKVSSLVLLLLCGGLFFTFALGSSSNASTSSSSGGTSGKTNDKLPVYKLNDDIYITNNIGKYRVKFTGVSETSDRNQFSDTKADRVVIISYEYENLDAEDDLYVSELNFKLYDKDNNKLESYPATETKYGGEVGKGRKTDASEAFVLNNGNNYIELEYYDNTWNSKPDCKVILEW